MTYPIEVASLIVTYPDEDAPLKCDLPRRITSLIVTYPDELPP